MSSGRDEKGRFVPGNRVRAETTRRTYSAILRECLDDSAAKKIIKKAIEDAKEGDARAREWLFQFVMPKLHCIEHTTPPEFSSDGITGSPFDQQVPEQLALILDECNAEEIEIVGRIMDRVEAKLPTGDPLNGLPAPS